MGLLSECLLLPLAPARFALWTIDRVVDAAPSSIAARQPSGGSWPS